MIHILLGIRIESNQYPKILTQWRRVLLSSAISCHVATGPKELSKASLNVFPTRIHSDLPIESVKMSMMSKRSHSGYP